MLGGGGLFQARKPFAHFASATTGSQPAWMEPIVTKSRSSLEYGELDSRLQTVLTITMGRASIFVAVVLACEQMGKEPSDLFVSKSRRLASRNLFKPCAYACEGSERGSEQFAHPCQKRDEKYSHTGRTCSASQPNSERIAGATLRLSSHEFWL